ncbi:MAG: hypothetical protein K0R77_2732 [Chryseobacterium sp.]|jgi:hypothetical protein|nr:hypothetical protein [Chryseobacterium sp.]
MKSNRVIQPSVSPEFPQDLGNFNNRNELCFHI